MSLPTHASAMDQVQAPGAAQPVDGARGNLNADAQNIMHNSSPAALSKVFADMSGSGKNQPNSADHVQPMGLYDSANAHDSDVKPVAHPESTSKPQTTTTDRQTVAPTGSGSAEGYGEPGGIRGGPGVGTSQGPGDGAAGGSAHGQGDGSASGSAHGQGDGSAGGSARGQGDGSSGGNTKDSGSAESYGEPGGIRGGPGVGASRGPIDTSPGGASRGPVDTSPFSARR
jgi:hypothetical protein